jgi:hypothetical protein
VPRNGPQGLLLTLLLAVLSVALSAGSRFALADLRATSTDATTVSVPTPYPVYSRSKPLRRARTKFVEFASAPFPYEGLIPNTSKPFLNVVEDGKRGRRGPRGHIYWEQDTYSDRRVLMSIPEGFDVRRPGVMIVFFHGHGATLESDVYARQRVPAQISKSGVNAVLIAPQFAVNAADSSAGRFWQPGAFAQFLDEAAEQLTRLHGDPRSVRTFASIPVVLVAYSGGYLATAWCVQRGGVDKRLLGVILLDALYGELGKFADWITNDRSSFFVSAHTHLTSGQNLRLQRMLAQREVAFSTSLDDHLEPGYVSFVSTGTLADHKDFVTRAWVDDPLSDLLKRLRGYSRR